MSMSIINELMAVPDKKRRRELELRAANESWSVSQTRAMLREKVFKTKRSQGARPLDEPKRLTDLLQRIAEHAGESRRHLAHWADSDLLKQTPKPKTRDRLRPRVLEIQDELSQILKIVETLSNKLKAVATNDMDRGAETLAKPSQDEPKKRAR